MAEELNNTQGPDEEIYRAETPGEGDAGVDDEEWDAEPRARDAFASWLLRLSIMLVVVLLVSAASMITYILAMRGAPRTALEHTVALAEQAAKEQPKDWQNWLTLSYGYARGNRYTEAYAALDKGRKVANNSSFDLAKADFLRMQKKDKEALAAYDVAEKAAVRDYKKMVEEQKKKNITMPQPNMTLAEVLVGRSQVLRKLGRDKDAVRDLEEVVKIDPGAADVYVMLGDVQFDLGRKKEAVVSYRQALVFIPDYEPALAGLRKTEGVK